MQLPQSIVDGITARIRGVMESREPDFVIGPKGVPYLRRWWVIPRNTEFNIYAHEILHDDEDRALHDHPWDNISIVLAGGYFEQTPEALMLRKPGEVVFREPTSSHRLILDGGRPALTLFITGPRVREWGFHCPNGWIPWTQFVNMENPGEMGPGCGD